MAEEKDVEIKIDEVNELLSDVPSWMVRWGITAIFLILLALLSLTFFIKYPDKLVAKTTITTLDPPVTLIAKSSGKTIAEVRDMFVGRQPMGRLGEDIEIAHMAVYLASDESVFTTGQALSVDGGVSI